MTNWYDASINAFKQQLQFNLSVLKTKQYPVHWLSLLKYLQKNNNISTIYDIGCGIGGYYKLLQQEFTNIKYYGYDSAINAIALAKQQWCAKDTFYHMSIEDLLSHNLIFSNNDLLVANGVCETSKNGDKLFEDILNLNGANICVQRTYLTDNPSYYKEYIAYDEIQTVKFYHNTENLINIIQQYGYKHKFEPQTNFYNIFLHK